LSLLTFRMPAVIEWQRIYGQLVITADSLTERVYSGQHV
jgi:hypothetical protein